MVTDLRVLESSFIAPFTLHGFYYALLNSLLSDDSKSGF